MSTRSGVRATNVIQITPAELQARINEAVNAALLEAEARRQGEVESSERPNVERSRSERPHTERSHPERSRTQSRQVTGNDEASMMTVGPLEDLGHACIRTLWLANL